MKTIVCLDMDCFFVSVERCLNPALKGKPVIVGDRVVAACSYETRVFGVRSGMATHQALRQCPQAIIADPHFEFYGHYSRAVLKILERYIPVIEQASIDEFYLDITGCERLYRDLISLPKNSIDQGLFFNSAVSGNSSNDSNSGNDSNDSNSNNDNSDSNGNNDSNDNNGTHSGNRTFCSSATINFIWALKCFIHRSLGLPLTMGMGANKHMAKLAVNLAKPSGFIYIFPGEEKRFLAPFPIEFLQGVGSCVQTFLNKRGIRRIGQLADLPAADTAKLLGKGGLSLQLQAQGKGSMEFKLNRMPKSMGSETTFPAAQTDIPYFKHILAGLTSKVCFRLRKKGWKAGRVTVKLRYADFKTKTIRCQFSPTQDDRVVFGHVLGLFYKLYQRRVRVRLLGVTLSRLQKEGLQELFQDTQRVDNLYLAVDKIKQKFGSQALSLAV
ncbi:hypothetical protein ACFL96_05235 [Thermoproteota archaeon]